MGIAKVKKIAIFSHIEEKDQLLNKLQEEEIIHISKVSSPQKRPIFVEEIKEKISLIQRSLDFLKEFAPKKGFTSSLLETKKEVDIEQFRKLSQEFDLKGFQKEIEILSLRWKEIEEDKKKSMEELSLLEPWSFLKYPPCELTIFKRVTPYFLKLSVPEEAAKLREKIKGKPIEILGEHEYQGDLYLAILVENGAKKEFENIIKYFPIEILSLQNITFIPSYRIKEIKRRLKELDQEKIKLEALVKKKTKDIETLQILVDFYENNRSIRETEGNFLFTKETFLIEGWIKKADEKRLKKVLSSFSFATLMDIKPREGEHPPVALENPKPFRPFELLVNLYGTPSSNELDPTAFLAPFFALFFGICLTDAGYGLFLIFFSLIVIMRFKMRHRLLDILFIGGFFTLLAGALTGGWFGNLFDKIGLSFLTQTREKLMLFDPLKNPVPFLLITLGLGYIQVLYGILLEVYDSFRNKNYGSGLFESLPWFLLLTSILGIWLASLNKLPKSYFNAFAFVIILAIAIIFTLSHRPKKTSFLEGLLFFGLFLFLLTLIGIKFNLIKMSLLPFKIGYFAFYFGLLFHSLWVCKKNKFTYFLGGLSLFLALSYLLRVFNPVFAFLLSLVSLLFLAVKTHHGWAGRLGWGFYNIYGSTQFLGIILSYVRLMALGMVTGGIALAINTLAWMVIEVPILGILIAFIILVFGHIFNLAINGLGGFVHSLRLQYVEFFPRFFTGGGVRFSPFSIKTKNVRIKRRSE